LRGTLNSSDAGVQQGHHVRIGQLGSSTDHIAHQSAMQSLRQAGQNQEMTIFTQGIYEARELALSRMQAEATRSGARGIVGVNVAVLNHVWGEHATEFLATGTSIRPLSEEHRLPETAPKPTFTLGRGRGLDS
jgi:uncharacterized protein YbjQ (UPF0145 family)